MAQNRLTSVDSEIQQWCDDRLIAGAVATVTHGGAVIYESAIGMMDIESGKAMQPDTIFRIASMTKPITAAAVLMLVDEGRLALDDPISAYLPAFAESRVFLGQDGEELRLANLKRAITIRHLLTHTSGMALGAGGDEPIETLWTDAVGEIMGTPGTTLQSAVRTLARLPLASQPGTSWRYGLSFEALAALVEVVSGKWYDQFLQQHIFDPLGMSDSGYVIAPENAQRFCACYARDADGGLVLLQKAANSPQVLLHDYESGSGWTTGGDGLVSTAADYARFLQMLLNRGELDGARLLKPETVAQMTRNQLLPDVLDVAGFEMGHGQGLAVRVHMAAPQEDHPVASREFTHAGGHGTYFWVDPVEALIGILMVQLDPVPTGLHRRFRALTYQGLASGGEDGFNASTGAHG